MHFLWSKYMTRIVVKQSISCRFLLYASFLFIILYITSFTFSFGKTILASSILKSESFWHMDLCFSVNLLIKSTTWLAAALASASNPSTGRQCMHVHQCMSIPETEEIFKHRLYGTTRGKFFPSKAHLIERLWLSILLKMSQCPFRK